MDKEKLYLSPLLPLGELAARAARGAGGCGHYNDPCLSALTQGREEESVHISALFQRG